MPFIDYVEIPVDENPNDLSSELITELHVIPAAMLNDKQKPATSSAPNTSKAFDTEAFLATLNTEYLVLVEAQRDGKETYNIHEIDPVTDDIFQEPLKIQQDYADIIIKQMEKETDRMLSIANLRKKIKNSSHKKKKQSQLDLPAFDQFYQENTLFNFDDFDIPTIDDEETLRLQNDFCELMRTESEKYAHLPISYDSMSLLSVATMRDEKDDLLEEFLEEPTFDENLSNNIFEWPIEAISNNKKGKFCAS